MDMDGWLNLILLVVGFTAVLLAIFGLSMVWQQTMVRRLRAQWNAEGQRLRFGPVAATMGSTRAMKEDKSSISFAAVAVTEEHLLVRGVFGSYAMAIPLDRIHWIGLRQLTMKRDVPQAIFTVQVACTAPDGWQAYNFRLREWYQMSNTLAELCDLPLPKLLSVLQDPLPTQASRMNQNVYGQWHADFTAPLYLAPDRLVFAWQDMIPYSAIRQIDLYDRDTGLLDAVNPFSQDLLRIEYAPDDLATSDETRVVGFQLGSARTWGQRLAERSGIPLTIHEGRKKKSD